MSEPVTFRSKIDMWVLIAVLAVVSIAVLGADALRDADTLLAWIAAAVVIVVGVALPVWILVYTRYELDDELLTVRCGPFRWAVPLDEISAVRPTLSSSKGPALSTRRLELEYGDGRSLMISPDPPDIFVRSLEARRAALGAERPAGT